MYCRGQTFRKDEWRLRAVNRLRFLLFQWQRTSNKREEIYLFLRTRDAISHKSSCNQRNFRELSKVIAFWHYSKPSIAWVGESQKATPSCPGKRLTLHKAPKQHIAIDLDKHFIISLMDFNAQALSNVFAIIFRRVFFLGQVNVSFQSFSAARCRKKIIQSVYREF